MIDAALKNFKNLVLRKYINHPNTFCYVCGSFTTEAQRRTITTDLKILYQLYFGCPLGEQDRTEHLMLYVHHVQMDKVTGRTEGKQQHLPLFL
jgi:hypothetical protein